MKQVKTQGKPQPPTMPAWLDDAGLDVYEFRVYATLCRRIVNNPNYDYCFESQKQMAQRCGMGVRKLQTTLDSLERRGLIATAETNGGTQHVSLLEPQGGYARDAQGVRTTCVGGTHEVRTEGNTDKGKQVRFPPTPQRGDGRRNGQRAELDFFIADCLAHYREVSARHANWVTPRAETKPTKRLRGQLKTLLEHYGRDRDEALAAFKRALEWAPNETWTQEAKKLALENLASNDKLIIWSMEEDSGGVSSQKHPKSDTPGVYVANGVHTPGRFMYVASQKDVSGAPMYCVHFGDPDQPALVPANQWEEVEE